LYKKYEIMKKILVNANKSVMFYLSIIALIGILWSCAEEVYNPGIQAPMITEMEPDSAFPSQVVVIHGRNFSSALVDNTVSFNGITATIKSVTTIAITTTVPDGATTGDVTVSTNDLTSAGFASFTVTEPVIPVISSIEPIIGKVGATVTITGSDFSTKPGSNIISFNGTEASATASTATSITTTVPAGATTGNVTVTVDGESNGIEFTVVESEMLIVQLDMDEDDAEEGALNGAMTNSSSDLELGEYDTWTQDGVEQGLQTIGVKFNNITIPPGSKILAASIQFTADNTGADPVQLTIYGENVANPEPFKNDTDEGHFFNITSRPKTIENVVWDIPEWANTGLAGPDQATPDIGIIIQALVSWSWK